ncbi:MAG: metallophosphoesterase [Deltaproteobacteria bacterium]|nr:metallophosphoesterase [Deltaproteobacteria bacterium]
MNKLLNATLVLCVTVAFFSCKADNQPVFLYQTDPEVRALAKNNHPEYPGAKFIVLSDIHYFAPELGTQGSAFEEYLRQDRKMLKEGPAILDAAIDVIGATAADFIILCGDLTKDGERASHEQLAGLLAGIEQQQGKPVYVVPGNHDISNGDAMSFTGDTAVSVPTVDPAEFRNIYGDFGFAEAIASDTHSLSYIVEPTPGLWLFALDSCRYRENTPGGHPVTDGKFYDETLVWIEQMLISAMQQNKAVIGFFHHGVLEHYSSNEKHFDDYLLDNFEPVSKMFAACGMRFVFTGHYHAQDITKKTWRSGLPNHFLFDIETGSLVTHPVPWRLVSISDQTLTIESRRVTAIAGHAEDFQNFSRTFVLNGMTDIINEALTEYGVPAKDQELLTPQIAQAYVTHLEGDEQRPDRYFDFTGVSPLGVLVGAVQGDLVRGWYTDLLPSDNDVTIDMATGGIL